MSRRNIEYISTVKNRRSLYCVFRLRAENAEKSEKLNKTRNLHAHIHHATEGGFHFSVTNTTHIPFYTRGNGLRQSDAVNHKLQPWKQYIIYTPLTLLIYTNTQ